MGRPNPVALCFPPPHHPLDPEPRHGWSYTAVLLQTSTSSVHIDAATSSTRIRRRLISGGRPPPAPSTSPRLTGSAHINAATSSVHAAQAP
uniref:Uncharacterized protein n=1 Tax=Oryza meridionalis TaxID=40149 RepID=A0A0E0F7U3_9ORYZ